LSLAPPAKTNDDHTRSALIAALTAHALEEEKERILAAGCDDFVRKPFREQEIFEIMAKHLGLKYAYENRSEIVLPAESEYDLTPEQLASLPANLLYQLHEAVVALDQDRTQALIAQIRAVDAPIARELDRFAGNLAYDALLELLEKCNPPVKG
jgi:CheY-like chemotaxis protein